MRSASALKVSQFRPDQNLLKVLTNSLLRKSPTSSVVEGPPIFIKTIAVGPFETVASWVTGGTTVAIVRDALRNFVTCGRLGPQAGTAT